MPQVGIDYTSNPAEFLAATREVMGASAEALKGFDLTNASMQRLAVAYVSTGDAAKQAAIVQQMTARQVVADAAASAAAITTAQREIQAAHVETATVTRAAAEESSRAGVLLDAAFKPDNLRSFRGELKAFASEAGGLRSAVGGITLLSGAFLATAIGAPLVSAAFTGAQKAVQSLGASLFNSGEAIKKVREEADKMAVASAKDFAQMLSGVHSVAEGYGLLTTSIKDATAQIDFTPITAKLQKVLAAQGADTGVITQRVRAALADVSAAEADLAANGGKVTGNVTAARDALNQLAKSGDISAGSVKQLNYAIDAASKNTDIFGAQSKAVQQLASDLHITTDQVYQLNLGNLNLATATQADIAQFEQFSGAAQALAFQISGVGAAAAAAQASIAAMIAVASDLPAPLAKARTNAAGASAGASIGAALAQAGSISALRAQGAASNAADEALLAPKGGGGGGGGGVSKAVSDARKAAEDAVALKNARLEALSKMTDASVAARVKVQEARNALAIDKKGTLDYFRDLATFHAAVADQTALAKQKATDAKMASLALKNAQLEATSNMADQATADAVAIKEAQAALDLDKKNSLAYWQDLKTLNQAKTTAANDAATAAQQAIDAAKQAKSDQIALQNSIIEAGINYADPLSALQAAVKEAQNTLSGDTAGTTQFNLDTSAYNQAVYNLAQATQKNTDATQTNTAAMTGVMAGGQVPGYIALRGANSSAFLPRTGGHGYMPPIHVSLTVDGKTLAETTVDPMMQAMNGVLTFNPRALVTPTG